MFSMERDYGFTERRWEARCWCGRGRGKEARHAVRQKLLRVSGDRPLRCSCCARTLRCWFTKEDDRRNQRVLPLLRRREVEFKLLPLLGWLNALAFGLCHAP